jgi:translation initiation factor IF-2
VIYALMDDLKSEINQKIPPEDYEITVGRGFVQKEFLINERNKKIPIAGCKVTLGKFDKLHKFRVLRAGKVIFDGEPQSLRNHKVWRLKKFLIQSLIITKLC